MPIAVAQSLIPSAPQVPLDSRTVVAALADIPNVANPYVGLEIFCTATGKKYRVKTLTAQTVGTRTVYTVGTYEAIDGAAGVTTLMLTKPEDGLHLIIRRAGNDGTRANSTVVIDTLNVAADRAKVKGYLESGTDGQWVQCPSDGFGSPYDGAGVAVDLSALENLPAVLFYAWATDSETFSDWQSITFPCCGGGGGNGGRDGLDGEAAGFGMPTASVHSLSATENPTVSVEATGLSTAKVFSFSFGIPRGEKGDGLHFDAYGTLSERDSYDLEETGFVYLDSENSNVYIKKSTTSGDWSNAVSLRGPTGPTGPQGSHPTIGDNGNWYIDGTDTGKKATGAGSNVVLSPTPPSAPFDGMIWCKVETIAEAAYFNINAITLVESYSQPSSPTNGMIWVQP